jgi:hypothetical protein
LTKPNKRCADGDAASQRGLNTHRRQCIAQPSSRREPRWTTTSTSPPCSVCYISSIENPAVPPGAKFETFVFLDQVLALDLARDVGQPLSVR